MILRYSLLLLGLVAGLEANEHCNFEKHLCKWYNLYRRCKFNHDKSNSLAGEKGYLFLSKDTCKKAGVYFYVQTNYHRFRLHYLINGTGRGMLAVYAKYSWGSRTFIWSCNTNHGPHWNQADIFVDTTGFWDPVRYIGIEAYVSGDVTVAIGNITPDYTGHAESKCPRPHITSKPKPRKKTTRKPTTKKPTTIKIPQKTSTSVNPTTHKPTTIKIPQKTSTSVNPRTHKPTTMKIPQKTSTSVNPTTHKPTTIKIPQTTSTSVNPRTNKPTTMKIPQTATRSVNPTTNKPKTTTSDQSVQRKTTSIPAVIVTTRYQPKPTTTFLQDVSTTELNRKGDLEKLKQSSKSNRGAIIGGSVFAVVFVIAVAVIAGIVYKRKTQMWDVGRSPVEGLENPVYR